MEPITKQERKIFTITEYDREQEYLSKRHKEGWKYITTYVGYAYFRKPVADMKEEEEIFFDDSSKLEMMQRIFKGRMIPMFIVFFLYLFWQFLIGYFFDGIFFKVIAVLLGITMTIYILVTVHFGIKYLGHLRRIKK